MQERCVSMLCILRTLCVCMDLCVCVCICFLCVCRGVDNECLPVYPLPVSDEQRQGEDVCLNHAAV